MSLNLSRHSKGWRRNAVTGAVVLGVSIIVLKTFPHLKDTLCDFIKKEDNEAEDNEPIELNESSGEELNNSASDAPNLEESTVDIVEWSTEDLKSFLVEKEINAPENASRNNLVSLVRSIQETYNQ